MSFENQPILITGAARSGTSLTAGIISYCGAWGGKLSGPTQFNKRGMFENAEIRNQIIKPFLRELGYDPLGQNPLPNIHKIKMLPDEVVMNFRQHILKILKSQGYNGSKWFYKGAKMCLLWPIWNRAFPEAKWLIVRREAEDIVNSCLRTSFMRAYKKRSGWLKWVAMHEKRFEEMHDAKLTVHEIWPQRMIAGDFTEIQMVVNSIGLDWDFDKIVQFVDPGLWRGWLARRKRHGK